MQRPLDLDAEVSIIRHRFVGSADPDTNPE